ncbi:hypothetical protein L211DRAFT_840915 [Terfezia boudieri ATCC MYA-4762]|uniref:ABM domain-containing protein n=1 Tax=Terfezia boudieri ATCC MYA-4762 TaxID=1051890 RepID=A0A3N4LE50_9PEZI|nr:hypothetical protein L211DRAFT_840915 [Terfezia boudieri ATCC MYA-4762]
MVKPNPPVSTIVCFPVKEGCSPDGHDFLLAEYHPISGFFGGFWAWETPVDGVLDKTKLYWLLNWGSYEDAMRFTIQPGFATFAQKIFHFSGIPMIYNAALTPHPPTRVFAAPIIEWVKIQLKSDTNKSSWRDSFSKFEEVLKTAPGYVAHATGWVVEEGNAFFVIIGWETIKAHRDWIANDGGEEAVQYYISGGTAESHMVHVVPGGHVTIPTSLS